MPMFEAASATERTDSTPILCPAMRGMWRRFAQRPLPSMMMAISFGSLAASRPEKTFASLRSSPAGTVEIKLYLVKHSSEILNLPYRFMTCKHHDLFILPATTVIQSREGGQSWKQQS